MSLATHRWSIVRLFTVALGLLAITWRLVVFPGFWHTSVVQPVAADILEGERLKTEILLPLDPTLQLVERATCCQSTALRSTAIIQFFMWEQEKSGAARDSLRPEHLVIKSLSCTPTDSFLWLALFSAEMQVGSTKDKFQYLRMSYRLGPHEGWIALRRNRVVVPILEKLPPDLATAAIKEFAELVENELYSDAAEIFLAADVKVRNRLVLGLTDVSR